MTLSEYHARLSATGAGASLGMGICALSHEDVAFFILFALLTLGNGYYGFRDA